MKTPLFFKHYFLFGLILVDLYGVDSKVVIMLVFIEGSLFLHLFVVFFNYFLYGLILVAQDCVDS